MLLLPRTYYVLKKDPRKYQQATFRSPAFVPAAETYLVYSCIFLRDPLKDRVAPHCYLERLREVT